MAAPHKGKGFVFVLILIKCKSKKKGFYLHNSITIYDFVPGTLKLQHVNQCYLAMQNQETFSVEQTI